MRRTAAALATTVLAALVLAGPLAGAGRAEPTSSITCAGSAASPECVLLDQLAAQLAPIQPVLALAGPVMAGLVPTVQGLATQADQPGGVSAAAVAQPAQALLDQLDALPAPVRGLLAAAQLDGLTTTLQDLLAALAAPVTGGQSSAATSQATPAKTSPSSAPAASSSAPATPSLGGSVSSAGTESTSSGSGSSSIPTVPVGEPLMLGPLDLPDFGFSQPIGVAPATEIASATAADDAAQDVQLAMAGALAGSGAGGAEVGVVVVLSLMLLGATFAVQAHQNRHTIPD